jgi:Cu2+-containing amine oxidase
MGGTRLQKLPKLTSNTEICLSFDFLQNRGAKSYRFNMKMYTDTTPYLKGFVSLPNQTRSYDRFQLFKVLILPENKIISAAYSVYSLKVLEKRNTASHPCIAVDDYDKARAHINSISRFDHFILMTEY